MRSLGILSALLLSAAALAGCGSAAGPSTTRTTAAPSTQNSLNANTTPGGAVETPGEAPTTTAPGSTGGEAVGGKETSATHGSRPKSGGTAPEAGANTGKPGNGTTGGKAPAGESPKAELPPPPQGQAGGQAPSQHATGKPEGKGNGGSTKHASGSSSACGTFASQLRNFSKEGEAPLLVTSEEDLLETYKQLQHGIKTIRADARAVPQQVPGAVGAVKAFEKSLTEMHSILTNNGPHGNYTIVVAPFERALRAGQALERACPRT